MSIAPYQQNGAQVALPDQPPPQVAAVAALVEWAHGAQAAHEVAVNLVETSFCPKHYQGKPHEATAAILAGLEVGLSPMAALQAFHSIQGAAAPKAITLRAIVQSHGHTLDVVESSATRAVVVGRRNGSGTPQTATWTIERAQLAGYPSKNANWKSQPEFMLIARATAECARMVASDAILGIPYAVEELEDGGPVAAVQAAAEQTGPRPARRRNQGSVLPAEPVEEVRVQEAPPVEERSVPGSGPIDPKGADMRRLTELLVGRFGDDRAAALGLVGEIVGRVVRHPKDLTYAEGRRVVERLEQMPAAESGGES